MSSQENPGLRVIELGERLRACPGYQLVHELKVVEVSHRTLRLNCKELIGALETFRSPKLIAIWDVERRDQLAEYQKEILRFVHNTFASSSSFLAHCTRHARSRYRHHPFLTEFHNERTIRISQSPLCTFSAAVRDFLLHEGILGSMATATIAPDTGQCQQRITIPTATLRYYSGRWQPSAKAFLNQLGESFDLEELLPKYQKCLDDFWSWYVERVKEIEKPILDELEQIREEMLPLVKDD